MFFRIQSFYMILALLILLGLYWVPLLTQEGVVYMLADNPVYLLADGLVIGIGLGNLFNAKKRKLQVVLNRLNIVLLFLFTIALGVELFRTEVPAPGLGMIFPLLGIILFSLANKAIIKDEELVRSADRLR